MNLSSIITGVPEYLEYAWLVAPNAAGQSVAVDGTQTTLTLNTEVADFGANGSLASNQITLAKGTYEFEARAPFYAGATDGAIIVMLLVDVTSTATALRSNQTFIRGQAGEASVSGRFECNSNAKFEIRTIANCHDPVSINSTYYRSYIGEKTFSVSTPTIQRTTIKLWKLK